MTSARNAGSTFSSVLSKAYSRELPARGGREKIAVAGARMASRGGAAGAFQHHLAAHELAVILAHGARLWLEAGVGQIGGLGPLPDIAERSAARFGNDRSGAIELVTHFRVEEGKAV